MVLHNAAVTGSLTVNGVDVSSITGSSPTSASFAAQIASLNAATASLNSYTSSATARFVGLETTTASLNSYTSSNTANITSLNSYTSSATARFVGLETATASFSGRVGGLEAATASLNTYTSSATARFVGLETATASFSGRFVGLEAATASLNTYTSSNTANITSLNSYTSSATNRFVGLEAATSSLNTFTSSIAGRVTVIESKYATTGSNTFIGTQTITGSILQSGNYTTTGTIIAQTINVQTVTSSIVYSCGSNIFGTSISNTQTMTGSVLVTGSLTIAGGSSASSYSGATIFGSTIACSPIGCFATSCATVALFTGCVGIGGTLNPSNPLHIYTNSNTTSSAIKIQNASACCLASVGIEFQLLTDFCDYKKAEIRAVASEQYANSIDLAFWSGGSTAAKHTERLRITSDGISCFACQVCAPSFVGGTITGTTIYGSTAVCSAVGKFTTCIDAGSGNFSGTIQATTFYDGYVSMTLAQINRTAGNVELQYAGAGGVRLFGNTAYPITFACSTGAATFSGDLTIGGTANTQSSLSLTRLKGYSNYYDASNRYGDYGKLIFNADSSWTSAARRWLITNAVNNTTFAIIRSADSTTDPSLGNAGAVDSGTVDFQISNAGAATFSSTITGTTIYGSTAVCSPAAIFSGCVGIGTTSAYTSRLNVQSSSPSVAAIKAGYGAVSGNGYTVLADNYTLTESLIAIGVDYSSGGLVLGSIMAPSTTNQGCFISTQAQFGGYGSAIRLNTSGEIYFYNGTQNSVIATGGAKAASIALTIANTGAAIFACNVQATTLSVGGTATADQLSINNGTSNQYATLRLAGSNRGGQINFYNQSYPTAQILVDQSGNVDILTGVFAGASVSTKFSLSNTGGASFACSVTANQMFSTTTAAGYAAIFTNTNGASDSNGLLVKAGSVGTEYNVRFANQTDTSTFFTVKGNGNVGIATTSPSYKLDVSGATRVGSLLVSNTTTTTWCVGRIDDARANTWYTIYTWPSIYDGAFTLAQLGYEDNNGDGNNAHAFWMTTGPAYSTGFSTTQIGGATNLCLQRSGQSLQALITGVTDRTSGAFIGYTLQTMIVAS